MARASKKESLYIHLGQKIGPSRSLTSSALPKIAQHGASVSSARTLGPKRGRMQSRASSSVNPSRSTSLTCPLGRASTVKPRPSKQPRDSVYGAPAGNGFEALSKELGGSSFSDSKNYKDLVDYFLGFWKAPHAASALAHLELTETKQNVKALQKRYGCWRPPPEVAEILQKSVPQTFESSLPDTKDTRNLKFVLKILGCPLPENKPYKQFLRAKTLRQKRFWLYKYQRIIKEQNSSFGEPLCMMRLKRLYRFFPDRFTEENGFMYFNGKVILFDKSHNLFYIIKHEDKEEDD